MSHTTATAYEVGNLYEVDPGTLKIGANVRSDPRPDAKELSLIHISEPTRPY